MNQNNYEDAHFGTEKQLKINNINNINNDINKELMLESSLKEKPIRNSRVSGKESVASKTLTDYVMKKMYRHD